MRITILQGPFLPVPPVLGGAVEKQWFALGKEFAARGHRVTHISRAFPGLVNREVIEGVEHLRIRSGDVPSTLLARKAADLQYTLRSIRSVPASDVIVTNTFWAPFILPYARKGLVYVDFARMPKGQVAWYPAKVRIRTPSKAAAAMIDRRGASAKAQARVIPNPICFRPGAVQLNAKEHKILYAGRVHPEKGIDLLLSAFLRLQTMEIAEGWTLDIAGPWSEIEGGGGERFMADLKSCFAHPAIRWMGPIRDPEELNRIYAAASVFCYPSVAERGETFGVAALEAMAWGCVPVVSALECFNDFIFPGVNGLVFNHRVENASSNLAQQLSTVLKDSELRHRLGSASLDVRETHSLERIASQFLEDFAKCGDSAR